MKDILCFLLFIFIVPILSFSQNPWIKEDKMARQIKGIKNTEQLINAIRACEVADGWSWVRIAFHWIDTNIKYDWENFRREGRISYSNDETIVRRKGICADFSEVFDEVVKALSFESAIVSGYAKGYGYKPGQRIQGTDHAWNAVKDESGKWHLFDVTWGNFYFDLDPKIMIYEHLPKDPTWQLLDSVIAEDEYEAMLPDTVYSLRTTFSRNQIKPPCPLKNCDQVKVLRVYKMPELKIIKAPEEKLIIGQKYEFDIEGAKDIEMYIIDGDKNKAKFRYRNGMHSASFTPKYPYRAVRLVIKRNKARLNWILWDIAL
jgi:hypothetical protein